MDAASANVTDDTNKKICKILKICESWIKQ